MSFIGCYLLQSKHVKAKGRTYIGYTVNPWRRIRQHNGDISNGAWKTKKWRPWDMVLVVFGFPTQTAALQFEWAWQHPERSLDTRAAAARVGNKARYGVKGKVLMLMEMLHTSPWKYYPLKIQFLGVQAARLQDGCSRPPPHVEIFVGPLDDLPCTASEATDDDEENDTAAQDIPAQGDDLLLSQQPSGDHLDAMKSEEDDAAMASLSQATAVPTSTQATHDDHGCVDSHEDDNKKKKRRQTSCVICSKAATRTWAVCPCCNARTHIECLAEHSLAHQHLLHRATDSTVVSSFAMEGVMRTEVVAEGGSCADAVGRSLPLHGSCPACGHVTSWTQVLIGVQNVGWRGKSRNGDRDTAAESSETRDRSGASDSKSTCSVAAARRKGKDKPGSSTNSASAATTTDAFGIVEAPIKKKKKRGVKAADVPPAAVHVSPTESHAILGPAASRSFRNGKNTDASWFFRSSVDQACASSPSGNEGTIAAVHAGATPPAWEAPPWEDYDFYDEGALVEDDHVEGGFEGVNGKETVAAVLTGGFVLSQDRFITSTAPVDGRNQTQMRSGDVERATVGASENESPCVIDLVSPPPLALRLQQRVVVETQHRSSAGDGGRDGVDVIEILD